MAGLPPPGYGARSPDGRWWWDGAAWRPAAAPPVAPPGPAAGVLYAGFGIRLGAAVLDALISLPLVALFVVPVVVVSIQSGYVAVHVTRVDRAAAASVPAGFILLVLAAALVAGVIYGVVLLKLLSATPGMRIVGLHVVREEDGGMLTWGRAWARWGTAFGLGLVSFGTLLDDLWLLWDPRKQTLHDKAARTFVVRYAPWPGGGG